MATLLKSEGKCVYCGQILDRKQIVKHLQKHVAELEKTTETKGENVFLLKVYSAEMFLVLLVKGTSTFYKIDRFLREIWLECCGHLSAFRKDRQEIKMTAKINAVLQPGQKFSYEYDFGSSTYLDIFVVDQYKIKPKKDIELLSRNEPLPIMCSICDLEPASVICSVHVFEDGYFCDECAPDHESVCEDFADYAAMPVVNSPRMGICAYEGGETDQARDGVYQLK